MLILCFAVVLAAVTADGSQNCCLPKRFQISHYKNMVTSYGSAELVTIGCNSSVDYELGILSMSCRQFSPDPEAYMLIQDYKHGKSYLVMEGRCNVIPLTTNFTQCFLGTKEVSNMFFGNKEIASLPVKTFLMELNGKMTYVSLSWAALDKGECDLVSTMFVNQEVTPYNCPAVQTMHSGYQMGNQPPPPSPLVPQSYYTANPFAQQSMEMEMQRYVYQRMGYQAPAPSAPVEENQRAQAPQEEAQGGKDIDEEVKTRMKNIYIDELMRRYDVSATFEMASGTVQPFMKYPKDDPVVAFYNKERGEDLEGKPWDCEADTELLRKSMRGLGTIEDLITHIVATRSNAQRQKMKDYYKTMYGKDLVKDLKSDLSGDYKDAILACFESPAYYDAHCVKNAIYGLGTDEQALIEILMTRTNKQLKEMRAVYGRVATGKDDPERLDKDIRGDTSGDFKRLLISASQGNRFELTRDELENAVEEVKNLNGDGTGMFQVNYDKLSNSTKAKRDAKRLYDAGEDRWGTDEEEFNLIFSTRNFYQLREVYREYVKITQQDIRNAVDNETSGNFRKGLTAIVDSVMNRPRFFAKKLMKSMKGLGTDEDTLIRIIASRSEIDMVQIKQEFLEMTRKTLWRYIKEDTSFNFKKILQALVGKD